MYDIMMHVKYFVIAIILLAIDFIISARIFNRNAITGMHATFFSTCKMFVSDMLLFSLFAYMLREPFWDTKGIYFVAE